ncbi:MAG: DUF983 domain-containing protein [Actinobacteria bacterium]|nr:DUF983 domain-containing protein [Actinomycetota bacterium]
MNQPNRSPAKIKALPPGRTLARGLRVKCPVCGQGRLFRRWFTMSRRCPQCDLKFERLEGHWLGAVAVNTMVTFGIMFVALGVVMVVAYPEYPIRTMLAVLLPIPVVAPLLLFPVTRTFWMAMDLLLRPPEPGEIRSEFLPGNAEPENSR